MNTIAPAADPADGNVQAANTPPRAADNIFTGDKALLEALRPRGGDAFVERVLCARRAARI